MEEANLVKAVWHQKTLFAHRAFEVFHSLKIVTSLKLFSPTGS